MFPGMPPDQHEHIVCAGMFRRHAPYLNSLPLPKWRNDVVRHAFCLKREAEFIFQIVVPPHGLLFRPVSVYDGFVVDSIFADTIFSGFLVHLCVSMRFRRYYAAYRIMPRQSRGVATFAKDP